MILAICIVFVLHVVGFLNAYINQSDRLTDVIYSMSFILITGVMLLQLQQPTTTHFALFAMIAIWGVRLGVYLGYRIKIWGHDKRFDAFRGTWYRLIKFWILQFGSILIVGIPLFVTMSFENAEWTLFSGIGIIVFAVGLVIETIADYQKFVFKQENQGALTFITSGLWSKTRHPNYFGEWLVWVGIFVFSVPFIIGIQWFAVLSPIWMFILLVFISGGNLLEKSSDEKYGHLSAYKDYKKRTNVFFPKLW